MEKTFYPSIRFSFFSLPVKLQGQQLLQHAAFISGRSCTADWQEPQTLSCCMRAATDISKAIQKGITSFTSLMSLGKSVTRNRSIKDIFQIPSWRCCARTREKILFIPHKNSKSEQPVGILSPCQENCTSTICRQNYVSRSLAGRVVLWPPSIQQEMLLMK